MSFVAHKKNKMKQRKRNPAKLKSIQCYNIYVCIVHNAYITIFIANLFYIIWRKERQIHPVSIEV